MLILYNANILTPEHGNRFGTALAIQGEYILDVGDDAYILANYGYRAKILDMDGKTIWPGLTDSHIHLLEYGLSLNYVDCETPTLPACLNRIDEKARQTPPGEWILGHGWNQNTWEHGFGNAAILDSITSEHPIYLTSKSLHSAWINSKAMQIANITADSVDPHEGVIQRDDQGVPTGILLESAVNLCKDKIPLPDENQIKKALLNAQNELLSMGVTGVHDFDGLNCFSALQIIDAEGSLHIHVIKGIPVDNLPEATELGIRAGYGNDHIRIGPVKLFADGALGPHTAAMTSPYEDDPNNSGILFLNSEQIFTHGKKAVESGLNLAIHAIGDRANKEVLDGLVKLRAYEADRHLPPLRHRIEHVQLINPDDQKRLAKYKIIASMQPIHAISDMEMADRYWGKRSKHAYAWQTIRQNKSILVFGSDAPVESPNPFWGLHAAVNRTRFSDGSPGKSWYPEQRLSLSHALQAYTYGPAYAAGIETHSGNISPGYNADLIILDSDPFKTSTESLHTIKPSATMVNGKWVWKADE